MNPLRFSRLKLIAKSPAHYAAADAGELEDATTGAMELGTAADRLILEQGEVLAYPGAVRRGKEFDAFVLEHPDALIVTKKEEEKALGIAEAVYANADASRLLRGVRCETLLWDWMGRPCRSTPDVRGMGFLTDLKTGETSDPRQFQWKVKRFAYHAQLAFYEQACRALMFDVRESYIVAVEQAKPHVVTVFRMTPAIIEMGDRLWRLWFEQLRVCEASGEWPPYASSIVDLDFPDDDQIIELGDAGGDVEVVASTK